MVSLNELTILTLRRIDETYRSTSGVVATGAGATLEVDADWNVVTSGTRTALTTVETIHSLLNEAQEEWFTTAGFAEASITPGSAWASGTSTKQVHTWTAFGSGTGYASLWGLESITLPTNPVKTLKRTTKADLARNGGAGYLRQSGTPTHWYQEQGTVRLWPTPSANVSPTAYGVALPERLSDTVGHSLLRDDEARRILPLIAAIFLIRRKFSDNNLFGRMEELLLEYADLYRQKRAQIAPELLTRWYREMSPDLRPAKK